MRVVVTYASFTQDTVPRGDTTGTTVSDIVKANRTSLSNNLIVDTEKIIPMTSAPETNVQSQEAARAVEAIPAQAELQLSSSSAQLHSSSAPAQVFTTTTLASGSTPTFGNLQRTNTVIGFVTLFAFGLGVVMAQLVKPQRSRNHKRNHTSERFKRMTRMDDNQQIKPKKVEMHQQANGANLTPLYPSDGPPLGAKKASIADQELHAQLLTRAQNSLDEGKGDAFEVAEFDAHHALEIATHAQDAHLEMQAYGVLSEICELRGDHYGSLDHAGRALKAAEASGQMSVPIQRLKMHANLTKGNACSRLGDMQAAVEFQRAAMDLSVDLKDERAIGRCYGALGYSYHALGHPHLATECMSKGQAIFLKYNDLPSLAVSYTHTAEALMLTGDSRAALQFQLKALDIAHRLGDVEMQRSILFILGSYRREEGLAPQSRAFVDQLGDHIEFAEQC